jgi:RNA polymerase sigma-70 factor (ECF subfamily)
VLTHETESAILSLARSASPEDVRAASDRLVRELSPPVYRLCLNMLGHASDAEDALQETMLSACRALPQFRGESKLSTWVYRIALHAALEIKSRRRRRAESGDDNLRFIAARGVPLDDQAAARQQAGRLLDAMRRLNPEQRAVIALFAVDGMKHDEIAAVLGVPKGTVWSRVHLARKRLAALIAD